MARYAGAFKLVALDPDIRMVESLSEDHASRKTANITVPRELQASLRSSGLMLKSYRRFGYVAYPLMKNTDILPILAAGTRVSHTRRGAGEDPRHS